MRNFIWRNIWLDESQFQLEYVTYCEHLLQKASSHGNWMSQKSFANRIENRPFWSHLPDVSADRMSRQLRCVRIQHFSILFVKKLHKASLHGNWMFQKSFANRIENRPFWSRLPDVSADGMSRQLRCVRLQHCSILLAIRVLSIHFSSHWIAIFSDEKILMHWLFMQLNHRHH